MLANPNRGSVEEPTLTLPSVEVMEAGLGRAMAVPANEEDAL